ncbi:MAG: ribosomal protein [Rickettsiaceae bacterium]|jgi:large subunit ribosomal protein L3|nr:ribosomal protein [Rickettsiaceae bacterium]
MINLIAKKIGMSHVYQESGAAVAFTMVQLYDNCVLDLNVNAEKEFDNILIGFNKASGTKGISKSVAGVFTKKNVPVHKKIYGCRVQKDSGYKTGDVINVENLLKEGDVVSVSGISTGKGFAGVMKRHNFRGLEASHGVSVSHRSHGSTGQRQDPGKVFKGKKMAGHMGVDKITVKNLQVLMINKENNTIGIKGAIPGTNGSDVVIKIAN